MNLKQVIARIVLTVAVGAFSYFVFGWPGPVGLFIALLLAFLACCVKQ